MIVIWENIRLIIIILILFVSQLDHSRAAEIFVSPNGRAGNLGTQASPVTFDEGLHRMSAALKTKGLPGNGMTMTLLGGQYTFTQPTVLNKVFSGTPEQRITIRAKSGETVIFDGGAQISPTGFTAVTDPTQRVRLAHVAADQIRVKTITNSALIARFKEKLLLTLSYNENIYLPSVYPNQGYAMMDNKAVVPEVTPPAVPTGQENYGIRAGSPPYQEPGKPQGWKGTLAQTRGAQAGIAQREEEMAGT